MYVKTITILGINPGTKYLAITVFRNSELREWSIKIFKGKWSKVKMKKILAVVDAVISRYRVTALAIKRLHPSRTSRNLDLLVSGLRRMAEQRSVKTYDYSIRQLEIFFSPEGKINKKKLSERIVMEYPVLFGEFEKEKSHKNPYYVRLFEAVALGSVCHDQLDSTDPT